MQHVASRTFVAAQSVASVPQKVKAFRMSGVRRSLGLLVLVVALATALALPASSAPPPLTIAAHPPDLLRNRALTLFGTIPSDRAKESVQLEARDCGQSLWRVVARVETSVGGQWTWPYFYPGITASIRARWDGRASAPVLVRDRAYVELRRRGGRSFGISVRAKTSFVGRRVLLQRLDPARGWTTLKSAELTKSGVPPGTSYVYSTVRLSASPPAGSLLRAFFPLAAARPCYLAGRSNMLRFR